MGRLIGTVLLMAVAASYAFAGTAVTPEIDSSSSVAAVALLGGGLIVLRARLKK